jgi:N6-adenosine-specific RNA methylase IME4
MITDPFHGFRRTDGSVDVSIFDNIETDRALTRDLFGNMTRKWSVIYADPPWAFENRSEAGEGRNPNQHYQTMTIEQMMEMPVQEIAEEDAILAIWVTDPTLEQAMHLIKAWGFTFKSVLFYWAKTWDKTDLSSMHETKDFPIGTGYITRGNPEQLWIASRGDPRKKLHLLGGEMKPDMSIRKLQFGARGEHSEKPRKFYGLLERLYNGPYLEMFARTRQEGWGSWGNQVGALEEGLIGKKKPKIKPEAKEMPLFGKGI